MGNSRKFIAVLILFWAGPTLAQPPSFPFGDTKPMRAGKNGFDPSSLLDMEPLGKPKPQAQAPSAEPMVPVRSSDQSKPLQLPSQPAKVIQPPTPKVVPRVVAKPVVIPPPAQPAPVLAAPKLPAKEEVQAVVTPPPKAPEPAPVAPAPPVAKPPQFNFAKTPPKAPEPVTPPPQPAPPAPAPKVVRTLPQREPEVAPAPKPAPPAAPQFKFVRTAPPQAPPVVTPPPQPVLPVAPPTALNEPKGNPRGPAQELQDKKGLMFSGASMPAPPLFPETKAAPVEPAPPLAEKPAPVEPPAIPMELPPAPVETTSIEAPVEEEPKVEEPPPEPEMAQQEEMPPPPQPAQTVSSSEIPATTPAGPEIALFLDRSGFHPSRIRIPAGKKTRLLFTTIGTRAAALIIEKLNVQKWIEDNESEKSDRNKAFEINREIAANQVTEVPLNPEVGVYKFHDALSGASGEIIVE